MSARKRCAKLVSSRIQLATSQHCSLGVIGFDPISARVQETRGLESKPLWPSPNNCRQQIPSVCRAPRSLARDRGELRCRQARALFGVVDRDGRSNKRHPVLSGQPPLQAGLALALRPQLLLRDNTYCRMLARRVRPGPWLDGMATIDRRAPCNAGKSPRE
jgi:hypothetical protein